MKKRRHPDWLKVPLGGGPQYVSVKKRLRNAKLHTICEEAKCPNIAECFGKGTATFLILGDSCTRNCAYCHVSHGMPNPVNENEPIDLAESVSQLGLRFVVITSVTRDDLADGGANQFSDCIIAVKSKNTGCNVEVLIPDFKGDESALQRVLSARPDVLNHNIEVVEELFPVLRPQGNYQRSLQLLKRSKTNAPDIPTKSGFMVGCGETITEIKSLLDDLEKINVDYLTIGQYLQPTQAHHPVKKYYTPEEFDDLKQMAEKKGFRHVESGPLVRSSYHAEEAFRQRKEMI